MSPSLDSIMGVPLQTALLKHHYCLQVLEMTNQLLGEPTAKKRTRVGYYRDRGGEARGEGGVPAAVCCASAAAH